MFIIKNFILFFLFYTEFVIAQDFEGKILYKNTCKSKNPAWTIEYCQMMTDSTEIYYFKKGNYKHISNDFSEKWTIYLKDNNAIYTRANKLFRTDASHYEDKILKTEINRNKIKILGYLCDELILTCASGIQKYYFNTITAVNPKLFVNHNHGNLNKIISLTKSIPLMTIFFIESEGLELKSVASKIVKTKLEEKTFEVPKNLEIFEGNY